MVAQASKGPASRGEAPVQIRDVSYSITSSNRDHIETPRHCDTATPRHREGTAAQHLRLAFFPRPLPGARRPRSPFGKNSPPTIMTLLLAGSSPSDLLAASSQLLTTAWAPETRSSWSADGQRVPYTHSQSEPAEVLPQ
ncbi:hypothetical protein ST47_g1715 [Ascochyta rabiei]|uniref:Uncharacterized protein n=1 Tax=Didymella rabiei TaxID=5454 RepID=A0A163KMZ3_DIDRA|nr:hypothetical protein ST47_g1715 [Ascochyta rabiei]